MSVKLPPISEAAFTRLVLDLARCYGWRTAHFRPAQSQKGHWLTAVQGDGVGFPDLVLVRERVIWAELKTDKGKLRPEQEAWLSALHKAGQEAYIWRPYHWDELVSVLRPL